MKPKFSRNISFLLAFILLCSGCRGWHRVPESNYLETVSQVTIEDRVRIFIKDGEVIDVFITDVANSRIVTSKNRNIELRDIDQLYLRKISKWKTFWLTTGIVVALVAMFSTPVQE